MNTDNEPEGTNRDEKQDLVKLNAEKDDDEPIEHVSDLIGSWGPFQTRLFLLSIIIYTVSPFSNSSLEFYMMESDFWCIYNDSGVSNMSGLFELQIPDEVSFLILLAA